MPISATGSYIHKDQIFPASRDGTATYVDHDENGRQVLRTEVKHLRGEIPMDPKDIPEERQFDSRDDMLYHIANERLKANRDAYNRGKISLSERYQGFDGGLVKEITRPVQIFMPKQHGAVKGLLEGIDTISDKVTLGKETKKKLGLFGKALNVPLKVISLAIKVANFALKVLDLTVRTLWAGVRAVRFLAIDVRKQGWEKAVDKKF
ncbi:MAG: hypothetical protein HRU43_05650, partial [Simkaniaceae bacterium]|nr:hypothetical protein [Simkaniaceae bacterium]